MTARASFTVLLATLSALLAGGEALAAGPDFVIVVSRHGVRPPYGPTGGNLSASSLAPYTPLDVPTTAKEWGIDPLNQPLTPHGALAIQSMGSWFRVLYPDASAPSSCDNLAFYSDTSARDISTAKAFLSGLSPKCASRVDIWTKNALQLFNQGNGATAMCGQPSKDVIESLLAQQTIILRRTMRCMRIQ